jgi:hypothetical protein
MMKTIRYAFIPVLWCLLAIRAHAHNALFQVTPQDNRAGGFIFHITSEPLPNENVQFRIVIEENQAKFERYPLTEIGILKNTQSARSIHSVRKLSAIRKGQSLVCVFTVDRKTLEDPDFCFLFSDLDHAIDDKILFLLSKDFVFARLKPFAPRHH